MANARTTIRQDEFHKPVRTPGHSFNDLIARARMVAEKHAPDARLAFARGMVAAVISAYWDAIQARHARKWPIVSPPPGVALASVRGPAGSLAAEIAAAAADLDVLQASYLTGGLYTALMPRDMRSSLGAYYTPPALCERLLDMSEAAGVDWATARVLDPACGGGAFLSPVAQRLAESLRDRSPRTALASIEARLSGFELDPFAAWMSHVFLEVTLYPFCRRARRRLARVVTVCDSLKQEPDARGFDLVIGNPPYGRVGLSPELREKFRSSLFGHANLYGVFTDLALRFTRPGGVISYVTPTSFLAGEYFKALRALLARDAPPTSVDFIEERKGVFADVLQETLLATYRRGGDPRAGRVHFISPAPHGAVRLTGASSFRLPKPADQPWLLPRTARHSKIVRGVGRLRARLADYGYTVSTGPLVWNRHKSCLRDRPAKGRYPLIWAESVRPDGAFEFRAEKRNHKPYFEPTHKDRWVVTDFPCVLLQRTTAKEQSRRLIAAELPPSFLDKHGAVVVENHLNMIKPLNGAPPVSPATLAALLNSETVDQVFRCINGSVAVSAYELEALPLPPPDSLAHIERLVKRRARATTLERAIAQLYDERSG